MENLPAARHVLGMFMDYLSRLKLQEVAVKKSPPRYSDFYRFYGCEKKIVMSSEAS